MRKILVLLLCFFSLLANAQFPSGAVGIPSVLHIVPDDYVGWATGARPSGVSSRSGWNTDSLMREVFFSGSWHQYWTSDKIKTYLLAGGVVHGTKGNLLYYAPDGSAYTVPIINDTANTQILFQKQLRFPSGLGLSQDIYSTIDVNKSFLASVDGTRTAGQGGYIPFFIAPSVADGMGMFFHNTSFATTAFANMDLSANGYATAEVGYILGGNGAYSAGLADIDGLHHVRYTLDFNGTGFDHSYSGRVHAFQADSLGKLYFPVALLQNLDTTNNKIVVRNTTTGLVGEMYWPTGSGSGPTLPNTINKYYNGFGNFPALNMDSIAQGAKNMFELSQNSYPTGQNGLLFWNSSFISPPNSNSAWTMPPGLFLYGNQGAYIPLTAEQNASVNSNWKGNSIFANFGLAGAANGIANKTAMFRGWGISNGAISGSKIDGLAWHNFGTANGQVNFVEAGINDAAAYGYAALSNYVPSLRNILVYTQASNVIVGQSGSPVTPANWAPYTISVFGNSTIAIQTLTNNSPINFKVSGTAVYPSVMDSAGGNVTYSVTIDGVLKGSFTCTSGSYGGNAQADCKRFANLGDSMHLVSLQRTGGTGAFIVNFVASNFAPVQPFGGFGNKTYVTTVVRAGTNGSNGYVVHGGSDTTTYTYNKFIKSTVYELSSDGLAVAYIDIDKYYEPKLMSQADSLHPKDIGATSIAQQMLDVTSAYMMPQDKNATQIVNENITYNASYGAQFTGSSGTYTPTVTNTANASGTLSGGLTHWHRDGDQIIVDGSLSCTSVTSANTTTSVEIPLPIPANLTIPADLVGFDVIAGGTVSVTGFVSGNIGNEKASIEWYPTTTGAATIQFHFVYTIQ